jgi:cytidylate kinase
MNSAIVIGLSGRVGSGKSSLASRLAEDAGWPKAAFGDYLRDLASQRGLAPDRAVLQELGVEQIAKGWKSFCSAVLKFSGWHPGQNLIVDGIRHAEAIREVKAQVQPDQFLLVYLAATEELLTNRLSTREGIPANLRAIEEHDSEQQVKELLRKMAELVLDASQSVPNLADHVWQELNFVPDVQVMAVTPASFGRGDGVRSAVKAEKSPLARFTDAKPN